MRFAKVVVPLVLSLGALCAGQEPAAKSPVTEISADLGPCWAEFHVTGTDGKGLYNVKVRTTIRYGFMSKRKLELEAATNADGLVKFVKFPRETKKPIEFTIDNGVESATREFDPATNCHATYEVKLKEK